MLQRSKPSIGFEPLSIVRAELGESPVWSASEACVWWVDITGRRVLRTGTDGVTETWEMPEQTGFVALAGAAVLCAMVAWFLVDDLRSKWRSMRSAAATEDAVEVLVEGMTCNGCVRKLTGALESAEGVASATVVLEPAGKATVVGSLPSDEVRALIRSAGFVPH